MGLTLISMFGDFIIHLANLANDTCCEALF